MIFSPPRRPGEFRTAREARRVDKALDALFSPGRFSPKRAARMLRRIYPHLQIEAHHVEAIRAHATDTDLDLLTPAERLAFLEGRPSMERYAERARVRRAFGPLRSEDR